MLHELIDLALEVCHRVERATANRLSRDQRKPALNLVQPRAVGRREVQMEARPTGEPGLHSGVLVGPVVVADQMHVEMLGYIGLNVPQERQELLMTVLGLALRKYGAVGYVERREQRRRAVAHVVVSDALDVAKPHRQHWLGALERLTLTLLIDTQNQRMIGRVQIQPDDVAHLLDEERIVRELEALRAVR